MRTATRRKFIKDVNRKTLEQKIKITIREMSNSEKKGTANTFILMFAIILLVVTLTPIGLYQIARSIGFNTASSSTHTVALVLGLLVIIMLVWISKKFSPKLIAILLLAIALLNLYGCSIMFSDFSRISLNT